MSKYLYIRCLQNESAKLSSTFLLNIYKIVSTFAIEIFIKLNNETFYYYIAIDFGNICFL